MAHPRSVQPCCHHGKHVHVHPCCRLFKSSRRAHQQHGTSTICSWTCGCANKILFLLRASSSNVWLVMRPDDAWNDCEERAQAPCESHGQPVNPLTTCSFPAPRTLQLQAVELSEKNDCLARCARFTKRATPGHGQKLHVHPCCRLREHCSKTSCRIRCDKVLKEQAIACRG